MPLANVSFTSADASADRKVIGRHVRRVLALLVVVALGLPAIMAASHVEIVVDGEVVELRTYATTVEAVLASAGVEVGPHDEVTPDPAERLEDGQAVEVIRAVDVTLTYRGHTRTLPVAGDTVADALQAAGLGDVSGLSIDPHPAAPIQDGTHIQVAQPVSVRILADDQETLVRLSWGGTVQDALDLAGVEVREDDELSLDAAEDISLAGPEEVRVRVTRIDQDEVIDEVRLPFEEEVRRTANRFVGDRVVVQHGQEGLRVDTYVRTIVDGEVVDRELASQEVVREPVTRIVEVGTKERPPPPPPPSGAEVWDRLAQCESGGNWHINTGNGYYGGLQFHPDTWRRVGGTGLPHEHSREEQIYRAERLLATTSGRYSPHWPACSAKLGLP
jgi:resuscitation-promoting factor RpfB